MGGFTLLPSVLRLLASSCSSRGKSPAAASPASLASPRILRIPAGLNATPSWPLSLPVSMQAKKLPIAAPYSFSLEPSLAPCPCGSKPVAGPLARVAGAPEMDTLRGSPQSTGAYMLQLPGPWGSFCTVSQRPTQEWATALPAVQPAPFT